MPINSTVVYVEIVTLPILEVAAIPVNGTPISVTTDPREEVAEIPVG